MALCAADLSAQKDPNSVIDVRQRHAAVTQLIADRWVVPEGAISREHGEDPFVVRGVGGDRLLHPIHVGFEDEGLLVRPFFQPENVGPEVVEVADIVRTFEQISDQVVPLVGAATAEKSLGFIRSGNPSTEFQVGPANKLLIRQLLAWRHAGGRPFAG